MSNNDKPSFDGGKVPPKQASKSSSSEDSSSDKISSGKEADAISMLKMDHRKVEALFSKYESSENQEKEKIISEICTNLTVHTMIEENIFYPACKKSGIEVGSLNEAQVEHDSAKMLIADLWHADAGDPYRDAKVSVLAEQIKHHVKEEEQPGSGIFAQSQKNGVNTPELAEKMREFREELERDKDNLQPGWPVSLEPFVGTNSKQESMMARYADDLERDSRGRFTSSNGGRGSRSGGERSGGSGGRSSYRDDDDYDRRSAGGERSRDRNGRYSGYDDDRSYSGNDRERDERGRFVSEDDRRSGRSRGYEDDRRYSRSGGRDYDDDRRGWYGDPEGHSEASRRGWDRRRDEYDDDRRSSRSRYDDDDRSPRYRSDDDDYRYSRSRGRADDDDGDGRGWYGDSRGHAEAARLGWERRRDDDDDDDDRRYSWRSSSDDNRGSSRGRGHGGWFGDSRGHAEAARRGWEDRR